MYWFLYQTNPESFMSTIEIGKSSVDTFLSFQYLSISIFTTTTFGEIFPADTIARLFVCLQILYQITFFTFIVTHITQQKKK